MVSDILLLGNPALYEKSEPVKEEEILTLAPVIEKLHETLMDYRAVYGAGRAIAAPQIGVLKRILYMCIDGESTVFINPELLFPDEEQMEVMDDCMSFPGLYVKVLRFRSCIVRFTDERGEKRSLSFEGGLSELIQHEYDHLDGILATMRAMDKQSYYYKGTF